ncbi:DNA-binding transcriptional regulator LsrR (DeoR family) [Curtobacterium pusillum]|uniref:DNA-binding transcriptional regulator LsrR (DeoR family) n=1 Tax=Curtobacterium pusillum TaxID=69373 RepID=A0AAW3T992_9MICO|nr:sugar-binding domain-containing protein [Curtobacterium pusillum]MBA8991112.1 DNA-binding transcriptional regulator LsrR (DeoR family) [Curtobacterium pusillum]
MTGWATDPPRHAEHTRFPLQLVYQAARMYYLEDATQADIAARLSMSRATVSRLVAAARHSGLVQVDVLDPFRDETQALAGRLVAALGLRQAQVVPAAHRATLGTDLAPAIAAAVARMGLRPGDVLLIGSGRTTWALAQDALPRLPGVRLAPTVGGQADPLPWFQSNEITRTAAASSGATPSFLFAEALPSVAMRASLDTDPSFRHIVDMWHRASGAIVGVGAPPAVRDALASGVPVDDDLVRDAAGDVSLNFFRRDGTPIAFDGAERMVRTPRETLAAIPHVVAAAVGVEKAPSVVGGVRAGLIGGLVTDVRTARAVLAAADES